MELMLLASRYTYTEIRNRSTIDYYRTSKSVGFLGRKCPLSTRPSPAAVLSICVRVCSESVRIIGWVEVVPEGLRRIGGSDAGISKSGRPATPTSVSSGRRTTVAGATPGVADRWLKHQTSTDANTHSCRCKIPLFSLRMKVSTDAPKVFRRAKTTETIYFKFSPIIS